MNTTETSKHIDCGAKDKQIHCCTTNQGESVGVWPEGFWDGPKSWRTPSLGRPGNIDHLAAVMPGIARGVWHGQGHRVGSMGSTSILQHVPQHPPTDTPTTKTTASIGLNVVLLVLLVHLYHIRGLFACWGGRVKSRKLVVVMVTWVPRDSRSSTWPPCSVTASLAGNSGVAWCTLSSQVTTEKHTHTHTKHMHTHTHSQNTNTTCPRSTHVLSAYRQVSYTVFYSFIRLPLKFFLYQIPSLTLMRYTKPRNLAT